MRFAWIIGALMFACTPAERATQHTGGSTPGAPSAPCDTAVCASAIQAVSLPRLSFDTPLGPASSLPILGGRDVLVTAPRGEESVWYRLPLADAIAGDYTRATARATPLGAAPLLADDQDGDGVADLWWPDAHGGYALYGAGAEPLASIAGLGRARAITTGDLDGDGVTDLAALTDEHLFVWRGPIGGTFLAHLCDLTVSDEEGGALLDLWRAGDVDGDAGDDLVLVAERSTTVIDGSLTGTWDHDDPALARLGVFPARAGFRPGGAGAPGDLDGDGLADVWQGGLWYGAPGGVVDRRADAAPFTAPAWFGRADFGAGEEWLIGDVDLTFVDPVTRAPTAYVHFPEGYEGCRIVDVGRDAGAEVVCLATFGEEKAYVLIDPSEVR